MNKINNEKNRTRDMETWNRLRAVGGEERGGEWVKKGEGTSQGTCMIESWTWTRERGLTVGKRGWLGGRGQKGKKINWPNCNRINNKKEKVNIELYFEVCGPGIFVILLRVTNVYF